MTSPDTVSSTTLHGSAAATLRQMAHPEFVASLSEENVAQLRAGLKSFLAWRPWVFNSLTALLLMAGGAILTTELPVPSAYAGIAWTMPLVGFGAGLVLMGALSVLFGPKTQLHLLLTPLSTDTAQCREALALVQSSQLCRDYQAQVLAHPREFLVADLLALGELAEREKQDAAVRERQQVCATLHQLDQPAD